MVDPKKKNSIPYKSPLGDNYPPHMPPIGDDYPHTKEPGIPEILPNQSPRYDFQPQSADEALRGNFITGTAMEGGIAGPESWWLDEKSQDLDALNDALIRNGQPTVSSVQEHVERVVTESMIPHGMSSLTSHVDQDREKLLESFDAQVGFARQVTVSDLAEMGYNASAYFANTVAPYDFGDRKRAPYWDELAENLYGNPHHPMLDHTVYGVSTTNPISSGIPAIMDKVYEHLDIEWEGGFGPFVGDKWFSVTKDSVADWLAMPLTDISEDAWNWVIRKLDPAVDMPSPLDSDQKIRTSVAALRDLGIIPEDANKWDAYVISERMQPLAEQIVGGFFYQVDVWAPLTVSGFKIALKAGHKIRRIDHPDVPLEVKKEFLQKRGLLPESSGQGWRMIGADAPPKTSPTRPSERLTREITSGIHESKLLRSIQDSIDQSRLDLIDIDNRIEASVSTKLPSGEDTSKLLESREKIRLKMLALEKEEADASAIGGYAIKSDPRRARYIPTGDDLMDYLSGSRTDNPYAAYNDALLQQRESRALEELQQRESGIDKPKDWISSKYDDLADQDTRPTPTPRELQLYGGHRDGVTDPVESLERGSRLWKQDFLDQVDGIDVVNPDITLSSQLQKVDLNIVQPHQKVVTKIIVDNDNPWGAYYDFVDNQAFKRWIVDTNTGVDSNTRKIFDPETLSWEKLLTAHENIFGTTLDFQSPIRAQRNDFMILKKRAELKIAKIEDQISRKSHTYQAKKAEQIRRETRISRKRTGGKGTPLRELNPSELSSLKGQLAEDIGRIRREIDTLIREKELAVQARREVERLAYFRPIDQPITEEVLTQRRTKSAYVDVAGYYLSPEQGAISQIVYRPAYRKNVRQPTLDMPTPVKRGPIVDSNVFTKDMDNITARDAILNKIVRPLTDESTALTMENAVNRLQLYRMYDVFYNGFTEVGKRSIADIRNHNAIRMLLLGFDEPSNLSAIINRTAQKFFEYTVEFATENPNAAMPVTEMFIRTLREMSLSDIVSNADRSTILDLVTELDSTFPGLLKRTKPDVDKAMRQSKSKLNPYQVEIMAQDFEFFFAHPEQPFTRSQWKMTPAEYIKDLYGEARRGLVYNWTDDMVKLNHIEETASRVIAELMEWSHNDSRLLKLRGDIRLENTVGIPKWVEMQNRRIGMVIEEQSKIAGTSFEDMRTLASSYAQMTQFVDIQTQYPTKTFTWKQQQLTIDGRVSGRPPIRVDEHVPKVQVGREDMLKVYNRFQQEHRDILPNIKMVAAELTKIYRNQADLWYRSGLITLRERDSIRTTYANYVPVKYEGSRHLDRMPYESSVSREGGPPQAKMITDPLYKLSEYGDGNPVLDPFDMLPYSLLRMTLNADYNVAINQMIDHLFVIKKHGWKRAYGEGKPLVSPRFMDKYKVFDMGLHQVGKEGAQTAQWRNKIPDGYIVSGPRATHMPVRTWVEGVPRDVLVPIDMYNAIDRTIKLNMPVDGLMKAIQGAEGLAKQALITYQPGLVAVLTVADMIGSAAHLQKPLRVFGREWRDDMPPGIVGSTSNHLARMAGIPNLWFSEASHILKNIYTQGKSIVGKNGKGQIPYTTLDQEVWARYGGHLGAVTNWKQDAGFFSRMFGGAMDDPTKRGPVQIQRGSRSPKGVLWNRLSVPESVREGVKHMGEKDPTGLMDTISGHAKVFNETDLKNLFDNGPQEVVNSLVTSLEMGVRQGVFETLFNKHSRTPTTTTRVKRGSLGEEIDLAKLESGEIDLDELVEVLEVPTSKYGEGFYEPLIKEGEGAMLHAVTWEGRRTVMNYQQVGKFVRELNKVSTFLGAGIRGTAKAINAPIKNPKEWAALMSDLALLTGGIAVWNMSQKNYKFMPPEDQLMKFSIMLPSAFQDVAGKARYINIGGSMYEYGFYITLYNTFWNTMAGKDMVSTSKVLHMLTESVNPLSFIQGKEWRGDSNWDHIKFPTAFGNLATSAFNNTDSFGKSLYEPGDESKAVEDRYNEYTSSLGIALAKHFPGGLSPKQWDVLAEFGVVGDLLHSIDDGITSELPIEEQNVADELARIYSLEGDGRPPSQWEYRTLENEILSEIDPARRDEVKRIAIKTAEKASSSIFTTIFDRFYQVRGRDLRSQIMNHPFGKSMSSIIRGEGTQTLEGFNVPTPRLPKPFTVEEVEYSIEMTRNMKAYTTPIVQGLAQSHWDNQATYKASSLELSIPNPLKGSSVYRKMNNIPEKAEWSPTLVRKDLWRRDRQEHNTAFRHATSALEHGYADSLKGALGTDRYSMLMMNVLRTTMILLEGGGHELSDDERFGIEMEIVLAAYRSIEPDHFPLSTIQSYNNQKLPIGNNEKGAINMYKYRKDMDTFENTIKNMDPENNKYWNALQRRLESSDTDMEKEYQRTLKNDLEPYWDNSMDRLESWLEERDPFSRYIDKNGDIEIVNLLGETEYMTPLEIYDEYNMLSTEEQRAYMANIKEFQKGEALRETGQLEGPYQTKNESNIKAKIINDINKEIKKFRSEYRENNINTDIALVEYGFQGEPQSDEGIQLLYAYRKFQESVDNTDIHTPTSDRIMKKLGLTTVANVASRVPRPQDLAGLSAMR